jgi:hypothetical protein
LAIKNELCFYRDKQGIRGAAALLVGTLAKRNLGQNGEILVEKLSVKYGAKEVRKYLSKFDVTVVLSATIYSSA